MSTKAERSNNSKHHILPIKIKIRQPDGSEKVQHVPADVRKDKRTGKKKPPKNKHLEDD